MMNKTMNEKGFTLIEVAIAMAILSIGILGTYAMQITSITGNSKASTLTTAATLNSTQLEEVAALAFDDTDLNDIDGDGTGKDTNKDGVDESGKNFGLDDATATTADRSFDTDDGHFTVFVNVASEVPMPNMKTIFVHVQDNRNKLSRPVTFRYYKADII